METNYPALKRPKRKLCYFTSKENPSKQWTGPLTLADVDRMFDDLDPSSHDDCELPPSPLLHMSESETNQSETEFSAALQEEHLNKEAPICQVDVEGDVQPPAPGPESSSPKLDVELDLPLNVQRPVKTSSPIAINMIVEGVEELDNEKDGVVSPILFEYDEKEEVKTEPPATQKPPCNGHIIEECDDSELESPPSKVALSKPKMSSPRSRVEGSQQENADPPVTSERREPEVAALKENSESVREQPVEVEISTRAGKDMTTFLQKLRDAGQPKPAGSRKSLSPVKVPAPPEPEDDFLILEDDTPLWFSIPNKNATSKKQRQRETSSTDKDSSTDKGTKDNPQETAQKPHGETNGKLGSQTVDQKTKKMKVKEKKSEETEPGHEVDGLCDPADLPATDLTEGEKPNKKKQKRLKNVSSKESEKVDEQPKDTERRDTEGEKPPLKSVKKAQKSSDTKKSKSLKDGNQNAKTSKVKPFKGARKITQESEPELNQEEDLSSPPGKETMNSKTQTVKRLADRKDKQERPVESEGSLSEDGPVLRKRKRRQPGEWWLSGSPSKEETKDEENQPTVKKSKQNNKESSAAVPPPVKTKKDRVSKRQNQTSLSQSTKRSKEKKIKNNNMKNTRGDADKMETIDEVFNRIEEEESEREEQQEVLDQDQDQDRESSPLIMTQRDQSRNSGDRLFHKVYHHGKMSVTPPPVSPRRPGEQLRESAQGKRRRKPPSNWWMLDGTSEDVEGVSTQHQEKKPKKQSKNKKSTGLGTPKHGNTAVSSKTQGGAPVPPLKVKPPSTPKTVKRSLAMFRDVFTSAAETPSRRDAGQNNKRKVAAPPAEENAASDFTTVSKSNKDVLSIDTSEFNSPPNQENPQDSSLKAFRSGPSSMIELEQYMDDNLILPSSRVHAALCASDLCAPPLKPLILQEKDKANLAEWFKSLWSSTVDNGPEITPDQFDWYFYQGRAIGLLVDLNCGSICNGKILLGSHMKKPLWVDHSAATVFNLLTSSVSVTINGSESRFGPGQSFMVPCGHAYSIHNVTAQPAVLYFTRVADSSD